MSFAKLISRTADAGEPRFTLAEPGQLIGVVGPSGSGKSTLVSLIPRFYDPQAGIVSIDRQDVRDFTIRSLRRQIAFAHQQR